MSEPETGSPIPMFDRRSTEDDLRVLAESLSRTRSALWNFLAEQRDRRDAKEERRLRRTCNLLDQALSALQDKGPEPTRKDELGIPGLTGTTEAVPLSSLVSFLADVHANGVLRVYGKLETYVMQFETGYLVYAHGDNPPEGMLLGEVLVRQGALHRADLARLFEKGWDQGQTLGGLLVRHGYVQAEALAQALMEQIRDLSLRLFSEPNARFRFYPGERIVERSEVRMNTMALLLESARQDDDQRRRRAPLPAPRDASDETFEGAFGPGSFGPNSLR
jgi:hypothetical protein